MPLGIRWLWATLGLLAVLALSLTVFGNLLMLLALAGLLALGLQPVVRFLERHGLSHRLAVPLTCVGIVAVVAAVIALAIPPLLEQASALRQALPSSAADLAALGVRWDALSDRLAFLPSLPEVTEWVAARAGAYLQGFVRWTSQVVGLMASAASIALMLYYLLSDGRQLSEQLLLLVPPHRRDGARALLTLLADRLGRFTLGTLTDMTLVGTLAGVGFWLLGVPNALLLGVFVGALNILPYVGALLGATPALIVAFGISPRTGLLALAVVVVVQQLEGLFIYPRVVGHAVGLHPLYVLIALTAGSALWGLVGVFLSIPAAVVIKTVLETRIVPWIQRMAPSPRARLAGAAASREPIAITFAPLPSQALADTAYKRQDASLRAPSDQSDADDTGRGPSSV
jgi:predicted PurR-regulated permease PerM